MVTRLHLPSSTSEFPHPLDRPIADTGPWPVSRHGCGLGRRNHDGRASRTHCSVERDGVIGGIRGHARDLRGHALDETAACRGIISGRFGDRLRMDQAGSVDPEMQLLPPSTAAPPVFHSRPFTLAHDGKTSAVEDEMKRSLGRNKPEREIELLTPARQGGVIRGIEVNLHRRQHGPQEALGLAQWQPEDQPQRQRGQDRHVRELPRSTRSTRRRRSPRIHRLGREPEGHVTPPDERLLIFRPIPDVMLRLVLGMNLRLHRQIVAQSGRLLPTRTAPRVETGPILHQRRAPTGARVAGWSVRPFPTTLPSSASGRQLSGPSSSSR